MTGEIPYDDNINIYGYAGINDRKSESAGFFRRALDNRNVRSIYPQGFLPLIAPEISDVYVTIGASSNSWDISNTFGSNLYEFHVKDSLNTSLGNNSPTEFDNGTLIFTQNTTNIDFVTLMDVEWLTTPLNVAIGTEFRVERFQQKPGAEESYIYGGVAVLDGPNIGVVTAAGAQVFPGFRAENEKNEDRYSLGFYIDLENKPTKQIVTEIAGRYERYSDFSAELNGKLALAYTPTDRFVLRASTSTGFRAPSLVQSHFNATATSLSSGTLVEFGTFSVNHPVARSLGATDLKPEKSFHLSTGVSYKPLNQLILSGDAFLTNIHDRIVFSGNIQPDNSIYPQQVVDSLQSFGVSGARFLTNAIDTQTHGIDLSATYDWYIKQIGTIRFNALFHYNESDIKGAVKSPPILGAGGGDIILDRRERERIESGQPKTTTNITALYNSNSYEISLKFLRFGSVKRVNDINDPSLDQKLSAKWLVDLDFSYRITKSFKVAVGGHNIFNVFPDFRDNIPSGSSFNGQGKILQFPEESPFGYNGAFFYLHINNEF